MTHNRSMKSGLQAPKTLQEAIVFFADADRCHEYAVSLRWPDGVVCPRCDHKEHSYISTRRTWFCKGCKKQFTVKVGTIFEDSPIGMDKWMMAVWMVVNCKNGVSSYEIARDLGITQKSAWFLDHRVRRALQEGSFEKLSGEVEVDETFIGGLARNMHIDKRQRRITGTGTKDKVPVIGILERGGKVRAKVVPNRKKKALQAEVRSHVEAGTALYTDALLSYDGLAGEYAHQVIDHAVAYVDGKVHTNGLENFWSLLNVPSAEPT
jgi:transposase-like protein